MWGVGGLILLELLYKSYIMIYLLCNLYLSYIAQVPAWVVVELSWSFTPTYVLMYWNQNNNDTTQSLFTIKRLPLAFGLEKQMGQMTHKHEWKML